MSFEKLNLSNSQIDVIKELGFLKPTSIQEASFSKIMSGKDFVGVAPTGTGKTLAYILPLLRNLKYSKQNEPRILVVVPTRELVVQTLNEIEPFIANSGIEVRGVYGGTNIRTQKNIVLEKHDIVIATPGRLVDLTLSRALKLKGIRTLVLDEFDEMLKLGFRTQILNIFDLLSEKRQNILFSATMSPDIEVLVSDFFNQYNKVEIAPHGTPVDLVIQKGYLLKNFKTKLNFLLEILKGPEFEKVLLFINSKRLADKLYEELKGTYEDELGIIHSNKSQNFRLKTVSNFESKSIRILIATDLIARGIDISDISHVINYDLPEDPISYIHRIGRTGRAESRGEAISLIAEYETEKKEAIELLMGKEIPLYPNPSKLVVSEDLIDEEKTKLGGDKSYYRYTDISKSKGAYHEKKDKNKKVNLGSPFRLKKKKYKKPQRRSGQKK